MSIEQTGATSETVAVYKGKKLYQSVFRHQTTFDGLRESLDFSVKLEGAASYAHIPETVIRRSGLGVTATVTDDPAYDWERKDVHAHTDDADDDDSWVDEDEQGEPVVREGNTRRDLAGEEVRVVNVDSRGLVGIVFGATYYGALPADAIQANVDAILDPEMREIARQMLAGTYSPTPMEPNEYGNPVAERSIYPTA